MTSEIKDTEATDLRRLADDAHLQTLTALSALEHLNGLVVGGVIDTRAEVDMDAFATYVMGIRAQLNDVATALDTICHATPAKEPEQPMEDGRKPLPFDLDLLDRASEAKHELHLLSDYACTYADGRAATEEEQGIYDAVALMTERAADMLGKLADVASEVNARQRQ